MSQPAFVPAALATFDVAYPEAPVLIRHELTDHPLLQLDALVELAAALPADSVEYNPADLPIGIDPADTPRPTLSIAETIRSIEENGSWMVLKRIEQHSAYAALLRDTLAVLEPIVGPKTGAMLGEEGFVFISSPHAVTPFHFDPEHNILLQIRGEKVFTTFPKDDERIVDPRAHEQFHLGMHHRNLNWRDDFAAVRTEFDMAPGDALHVPVKTPHWVKVKGEVSISLSVTWRSEWSYEEAYARGLNHMLRRAGLSPNAPASFPQRNRGKALAYRMIKKVGVV